MEKYTDQLKLDLNKAIEHMLSKTKAIELIDGYNLEVSKVGAVLVNNISELRLLDFIGGRKFEVASEGRLNISEKTENGDTLRLVSFRLRESLVNYDDTIRKFAVSDIGKFTALEFVKN